MELQNTELNGSTLPRVDIKLEQNSKGVNVTVHVYQGVTEKEIKELVDLAVSGLEYSNKKVAV